MITAKRLVGPNWKRSQTPIKTDRKRNVHGYGKELIVNLYDCDLKKISSRREINKFVVALCDRVIKMRRYGKPLIPNFGHEDPTTSGYSLVQLIETSSITGHFSDFQKSCYLNIFSCADFNEQKTAQFCKKFFGAGRVDAFLILRP